MTNIQIIILLVILTILAGIYIHFKTESWFDEKYPNLIIERNFLRAVASPVYYKTQVLGMILTSAYSEIETCPNRECLTASGKLAKENLIACPRKMNLGERVEIDGKVYECADRLHEIYDDRIDFWMGYGEEGYRRAKEYGLQWKQVLLVN